MATRYSGVILLLCLFLSTVCTVGWVGQSYAGEKEEMAWKFKALEEKGKRLQLEYQINEREKAETLDRFKELSRLEQERLEAEAKAKEQDDESSE